MTVKLLIKTSLVCTAEKLRNTVVQSAIARLGRVYVGTYIYLCHPYNSHVYPIQIPESYGLTPCRGSTLNNGFTPLLEQIAVIKFAPNGKWVWNF